MIPRTGVPPGRPHRILEGHFNVEQAREIEDGEEQEKKHGRDEGKFQHGGPASRHTPAPSGSHVIETEPSRRSLGFGYKFANSHRGRLLLLTSHTNWYLLSSRAQQSVCPPRATCRVNQVLCGTGHLFFSRWSVLRGYRHTRACTLELASVTS